MRRLTGVLVLLAALACTDGSPEPRPTPSPSTPTPSTPAALGGSLLFVDGRDVRLAGPDGVVRTIGTHVRDAHACAWSGDGRYAAWVRVPMSSAPALYVHDPTTGRTVTVSDLRLSTDQFGGTATGFVAFHRAVGKRPELVVVDPARLLAGGKPKVVELPLRTGSLLATGRRVLVQQPKRGAAFTGGPSVVYDVGLDGRAKPLFTNPRDLPLSHAAFTADGRRLVHGAGVRVGKDRTNEFVVVRDLAAGKELDVPMPAHGDAPPTPLSIVTGADGQTVVTLGFRGPDGEDVARKAYVLDGTSWREVADDAVWAATGPTGALAVIGPGDPERLTVDGRPLADEVECAAWQP